jgi:hypothetical protein
MPGIILPSRASGLIRPRSIAGVDRSNHFGSRARALVLPQMGGVQVFARGKINTPFFQSSDPSTLRTIQGGYGIATAPLGTSYGYYRLSDANVTDTVWDVTGKASWFVFCFRKGDNPNGNAQVFANSSPDTSPYDVFGIADSGGTGGLTISCNQGTTLVASSVAAGFLTGVPLVLCGTYDGTDLVAYRNGLRIDAAYAPGAIASVNAGTRGVTLGNYYNYTPTARSFNGEIYLAGLFDYPLTAAEVKELSANPWQLFRQEASLRTFIPVPRNYEVRGVLPRATNVTVQQPQVPVEVDWTNSITRGMTFAWTPFSAIGVDLVSGVRPVIAGTGSVGSDSGRLGFSASGSSSRLSFNPPRKPIRAGSSTWTLLAFARPTPNATGTRQRLINLGTDGSSPFTQYDLFADSGSSANFDPGAICTCHYDNEFKSYANSSNTVVDGRPHVFVGRRNNDASDVFCDGFNVTSGSGGTLGVSASDTVADVAVGGIEGSANACPGANYLSVIWERALSDAEIRSLARNPWQIFRPVSAPSYVNLPVRRAQYIKTTKRTAQPSAPRIDWSNPITRKLAFAYVPTQWQLDLVGKLKPTYEAGVGLSAYGGGRIVQTVDGYGVHFGIVQPLKRNGNGVSVFGIANPPNTSATFTALLSQRADTDDNYRQFGFLFNSLNGASSGNPGIINLFYHDSINGGAHINSLDWWTDGKWHAWGGTLTDDAPVAMYVDGMKVRTDNLGQSCSTWESSLQQLAFGKLGKQATTYSSATGFALVAAWNRQLSAGEHASLAANPWQLFRQDDFAYLTNEQITSLYPTLSAAQLINLLATQATPRVTVDWP